MPGRRPSATICSLLAATGFLLAVASTASAESITPEQERFFEEKVRPVLAGHCFECHSAKKQQAELRLDSRDFALKGSPDGPALVPGRPDESRLIQVIRYSDEDTQMPPDGKLADEQIAALVEWVKMGAPWPASETTAAVAPAGPMSIEEGRKSHWAYRPIGRPAVPDVKGSDRARTPIDRFILAKLEAQGLTLAPEADRRTLIRRATLDLCGIPPTADEVDRFVNDASPDAYERLINRLLASPAYGERWGRYWLDVARYADTKGYVFTSEPRYPYAYTYRDYVIGALNEDRPYDRFILEQLAADQLELGEDKSALAALGFLTVGRRFLNNTHDTIDDRIDVVARGLMGFTAGCARCHDHKFDPIPTADYYALYGVFQGSYEPDDLPLLGEPEQSAAYDAYAAELAKRQAELDQHLVDSHASVVQEARTRTGDYLLDLLLQDRPGERGAVSFAHGEPRGQIVSRWKTFLQQTSKSHHPVLAPLHVLMRASDGEFEQKAGELLEQFRSADAAAADAAAAAGRRVNKLVRQAFLESPPKSVFDVARIYGDLLTRIEQQWSDLVKENSAAEALPDGDAEGLRQLLYAQGAPAALTTDDVKRLFDRAMRNRQRELQKKVEAWKAGSPAAPPRAMVMLDSPNPPQPRIFVRGNPGRPGDPVPKRFPQVLSPPDSPPFQQGSGRLELARAIVAETNPLTARVIVNRVWLHHFGAGIVGTPSDFGTRGEPPTHPELLDYLAHELRQSGWSLKHLHRDIMLSAVYRQSSIPSSPAASLPASADAASAPSSVDPENRLLWSMRRQRLGFEAMRDSMLAVSGRLDPALGGRPVEVAGDPGCRRRTVYGLVNRNDLPGMYRIFDFADPDASSPMRPETTVPQQALFAINSPFVIQQAQALAAHPDVAAHTEPSERVEALYRRVLGRSPQPNELQLALKYIESQEQVPKSDVSKLNAWEKYAQVLLLTNEFLFVD